MEAKSHFALTFLYQTTLAAEELVEAICAELELPAEGRGRFAQLRVLNDFLLGEAERGSTVALARRRGAEPEHDRAGASAADL